MPSPITSTTDPEKDMNTKHPINASFATNQCCTSKLSLGVADDGRAVCSESVKQLIKFALGNAVPVLSIDTDKNGAALALIEKGNEVLHSFAVKPKDLKILAREITFPGLVVVWPAVQVVRPKPRKDVLPQLRKPSPRK